MLFDFIGTYLVLLVLFYSGRIFGKYDFLIVGIVIALAVYLDLHVNPAYTTLNILSGKASSSELVTRIIPQIIAAILAAVTVSLLP